MATEVAGLQPWLYGIPVSGNLLPASGFIGWFDAAYLAIGAAVVYLLRFHLRHGLPFVPAGWLGKGQLFYLLFLWSVVFINFTHVLPRFTASRLVTEWAMTIDAVVCTLLLIAGCYAQKVRQPSSEDKRSYSLWIRNATVLGVLGSVIICFAGWGWKRALFGDSTAPGTNTNQIRFGPNNTNTIK